MADFSMSKLRLGATINILNTQSKDPLYCYNLFNQPQGIIPFDIVDSTQNSPGILTRSRHQNTCKNLICISMYNQDVGEIYQTLKSILRNQGYMNSQDLDQTASMLLIIVDGPAQINNQPNLLQFLYKVKFYDPYLMRKFQDESELERTEDYMYCFQSQIYLSQTGEIQYDPYGTGSGIQVVFAIKPLNMKKLHSHLWLFYSFCRYYHPEYVFLIDMGTRPTNQALIKMINYMQHNPSSSGACGEIIVQKIKGLNMVLRAQWYQYKLSHALIKTFQHVCGFIPVLPGAFSMYRWKALTANNYQVLKGYFKPFTHPNLLSWSDTNIYFLAEDRVMCDKVVKLSTPSNDSKCCKTGHYLSFVKEAKAYTDGQKDLAGLIAQRRRWNNGSWFALINLVFKFRNLKGILISGHGCWNKFLMLLQVAYYSLVILFQWCSVGAYYLAFSISVTGILEEIFGEGDQTGEIIFDVVQMIFVLAVFAVFCISLSMDSKEVPKVIWRVLAWYFSFTVLVIFFAFFYYVFTDEFESPVSEFAAIFVPAGLFYCMLIYGEDYWGLLVNLVPYVLMIPSYINILIVFSISKTDDVTWGTRSTSYDSKGVSTGFKLKKVAYLFVFVVCNLASGLIFEELERSDNLAYMYGLYALALILLLIPLIGETIFMLGFCCRKCKPI